MKIISPLKIAEKVVRKRRDPPNYMRTIVCMRVPSRDAKVIGYRVRIGKRDRSSR